MKKPFYIILAFLLPLCNVANLHAQDQTFSPIEYPDTVILYSPALPVIFDGKHLNLTNPLMPEFPMIKPLFPPLKIAKHRLFADANNRYAIIRCAYDSLIKNSLHQVKYTTADVKGHAESLKEMGSNIFQNLFSVDNDLYADKMNRPERFQPKRRYWIYNGNHTIQLSQNYISQNWYKGGVRNLNLLNRHDVSFNYKKDKFQINNIAEWRVNIYTNPNDTFRIYRIAEDLVRTYSDFGIQAFQNWFYSANIEIKTQLFNNFVENSKKMIMSALSPVYINIGILGMRYQIAKLYPKVKGKKLNLNADISPLSIKYIAVVNKNENIDPTAFGIDAGKWSLTSFGSTVNARLVFYFNRYVNVSSRFSYFTNYKNVTVESENALIMPINRYFSTNFYLYLRYDDNKNLAKDPTFGYFQINELLSFGFNYHW